VFLVDANGIASMQVATPRVSTGHAASPAATATMGAGPRRWTWPVGIAVLAAVLAAGYLALRGTPPATLDKSVAVLPFTNLSDDQANAYFTDGMQDQILTNLSRIRDLKVISRTSVERYRGQKLDMRTIARELGVATLVEGSVQRVGDRVRITAQLIDAGSDAHLWADSYDRDIADVFTVQSEIARRIAGSLQATLLPAEAEAIAAAPTRNRTAYDLYLRAQTLARPFMDDRHWDERTFSQAVSLLEDAVKQDPGFALGWAQLAILELTAYWTAPGIFRTRERLDRAKSAAERAMALQPGLGEAHYAKALYHYYGRRDYDSALREIQRSEATMRSAEVAFIGGALARRQGRFEDAAALFQRAAVLDPRRSNNWVQVAGTQLILGRRDDARGSLDRAVTVSANPGLTRVTASLVLAQYTGDLDGWRSAIESLPPGSADRASVAGNEFFLRLHSREYDQAEDLLSRVTGDRLDGAPVAWLRALVARGRGDREAARAAFSQARPALEALVAEGNDSLLWALGATYAGLGLRAQALAIGQRAADLMKQDAYEGPRATLNLAFIHLILGERDRALVHLEAYQEKLQGRVSDELDWLIRESTWDPLRDDPRFQRVVAAIREPHRSR